LISSRVILLASFSVATITPLTRTSEVMNASSQHESAGALLSHTMEQLLLQSRRGP